MIKRLLTHEVFKSKWGKNKLFSNGCSNRVFLKIYLNTKIEDVGSVGLVKWNFFQSWSKQHGTQKFDINLITVDLFFWSEFKTIIPIDYLRF